MERPRRFAFSVIRLHTANRPLMHNALFDALGINAAYLPYAPEPENFADAIKGSGQ